MQIFFKRTFVKHYAKLTKSDRILVDDAVELFEKNPLNPKLNNHPLHGKLDGKRVISAKFDLRIVFEEKNNYTIVIMLAVGAHSKVY